MCEYPKLYDCERLFYVFLLQEASTLADLDSGNMEKIIQDENVTLYVWANLKKNPRYSPYHFPRDTGVQ